MTNKQIEVDEEVFALLESEARPFVDRTPNDVLRRLLLGERPGPVPGKPGDLLPLLQAGRLHAGDRLVHHQTRKGRIFAAEVTEDGYIKLEDGRRFATPSPALSACVGSQINGWGQWTVERTGQPLQELRSP
jgi:hypothetical protein